MRCGSCGLEFGDHGGDERIWFCAFSLAEIHLCVPVFVFVFVVVFVGYSMKWDTVWEIKVGIGPFLAGKDEGWCGDGVHWY